MSKAFLTNDDLKERPHRRALLGAALQFHGCSIQLARFCELVFDGTFAGRPGEWHRVSYLRLASRPWGLCCTASQAEGIVQRAIELRLVAVRPEHSPSGARDPNAYRIDWDSIEQIVANSAPQSPAA